MITKRQAKKVSDIQILLILFIGFAAVMMFIAQSDMYSI